MTTSRRNLSREQIENLLAIGGWRGIIGASWYGLKRQGMRGVVFFDEDDHPAWPRYEPNYGLEPGDDNNTHTLRWVDIMPEDKYVLGKLLEKRGIL